jgi:exopolyphosphatase/guanosine-5'-triphosphate,3'-diphosphate pyrophosphatase
MKLAAVDIGSNAIRPQITNVIEYKGSITFKKLEYVRFPLRLGHDVFTNGKIGLTNRGKFIKLMHAFQLLIDLYEVDDYMICATSAMREAENGEEIARKIRKKYGLKINIISGMKEASMINKAIHKSLDDDPHLHIDVGGGSTELSLYLNRKILASESFKIGSVRRLEHHDSPGVWKRMENWLRSNVDPSFNKIVAIGTGGNINKIFEMALAKPGKSISIHKVEEIKKKIEGFDLEERINVLQLNPDRADVIIPASEIYLSCMKWANCNKIMVPDVGLKDGILEELYLRNHEIPGLIK